MNEKTEQRGDTKRAKIVKTNEHGKKKFNS